MTLDVLICSYNKGIVRIADGLLPPQPGVRYVVSYQYTDERYLDLIPAALTTRPDVSLYRYAGKGLSANRNLALDHAQADLVLFADDDTHLLPEAPATIREIFTARPDLDVAFFRAGTYTGKPLKQYPDAESDVHTMPAYGISSIETVCRRQSIQGRVRFDERFGLGTKFLTCGEEDIWFEDARRCGLTMRYFPRQIIETSTMLKKSLIYIDPSVQRSHGAFTYYMYGSRAWWMCLRFALHGATHRLCHFLPVWRHLAEGIRYMRRTS